MLHAQNQAAEAQRRSDSIAAAERDIMARGRVVIAGLPAGGTIAIGGRLFRNGETFTGDTGVTYVGSASADNKEPQQRAFAVRGGETDTLVITLNDKGEVTVAATPVSPPQPQRQTPLETPVIIADSGDVRFVVLPPHSDIYVDGQQIGKGRFLQRRLPVGTHTVRYAAPGCTPDEFQLAVEKGSTRILPPVTLKCR